MVQNDKKLCLVQFISQEAYIWLWFLVHICKMMTSLDAFFIFFKVLVFQFVRGCEGKNDTNWKKFCPSHSISEELYLIWFLFLVHMCKMMISRTCFFIFPKFWFFRVFFFWGGGGGGGGKGPKMIQNFQFKSVTLYILRTVDNIIRLLVCRCKMISLGVLSVFFKNMQIIVNINIFMFFIGPLQTFFK